jgi:hypothetical protein
MSRSIPPSRSPRVRSIVAATLLAACEPGDSLDDLDDDVDDATNQALVDYGAASIYGIHSYPKPGAPPPSWLGGGARRLWVVENVLWGPQTASWYRVGEQCPANATCGVLGAVAAQNTEIIARIDDYGGGQFGQHTASVPQSWEQLWAFKQTVKSTLFANSKTAVTRFAKTVLVGNEVNLCSENIPANEANAAGACVGANARFFTQPAWYAEVYTQMRIAIREASAAVGYPDVRVMVQGSSPLGYGRNRYTHYVLQHLCGKPVDAIALHAYGFADVPGEDGTFGFSAQVDAQMRGIDEACGGEFKNVPVVITEFSRGSRDVEDSAFVENVYDWIAAWNANPKNHPIAGATYFLGRDPTNAFPHEHLDADDPNDHIASKDAFARATAKDRKARIGGSTSPGVSTTNECSTGGTKRSFSETPFSITGPILNHWNGAGALQYIGLPISNARLETNSSGAKLCTQWFERRRVEYDPKTGKFYGGLLGNERVEEDYERLRTQGALEPHPSQSPGCVRYGQTGFQVCGAFKTEFEKNGGVVRFGYPKSREFEYETASGKRFAAQYFERARLEWQQQPSGAWVVMRGLLGNELYRNER